MTRKKKHKRVCAPGEIPDFIKALEVEEILRNGNNKISPLVKKCVTEEEKERYVEVKAKNDESKLYTCKIKLVDNALIYSIVLLTEESIPEKYIGEYSFEVHSITGEIVSTKKFEILYHTYEAKTDPKTRKALLGIEKTIKSEMPKIRGYLSGKCGI